MRSAKDFYDLLKRRDEKVARSQVQRSGDVKKGNKLAKCVPG
jgi:hypothetical protein